MATSRSTKTQATQPAEDGTQATEESVQQAEEKTSSGANTGKLVSVHNPQRFHYVQPSTGIRIGSGATVEIRDDGWLKLQLEAGVLKKA